MWYYFLNMRITIIGHSSSGKSTLAKNISAKLGIPHLHIDRLWFESGAYKLLKPEDALKLKEARAFMKQEVEKWTEQKDWVSDGWYSQLQPLITEKADQLIFLDIPLWIRLKNHIQRTFFSDRHRELSKWDDIKFIIDIIYRTFNRGPKIRRFTEEHKTKLVVLRSYKEVEEYVQTFD